MFIDMYLFIYIYTYIDGSVYAYTYLYILPCIYHSFKHLLRNSALLQVHGVRY
jgi:hypothetical protein